MHLAQHLIAPTSPEANESNIIVGDGYRITVLTDELIRVERGSQFSDNATQTVWHRNLGKVDFSLSQEKNILFIQTKKVKFWFNKKKCKVFAITFLTKGTTVKCSNRNNLKGTYRTLDFIPGKAPIKKGIMSKDGVSILNDTKSLLLVDGKVEPRKHKTKDIYIFAYGRDYRRCLLDFYKLTGQVPLIPRYALGNWWSRYYAYSQQEYINLMERFKKECIPITVAVIDMDWHWVDVEERFGYKSKGRLGQGAGWTGYSWNTELFPSSKDFLKYLQDNNYRTALNIHPADGIRWFEKQYPQMLKAMGMDNNTQQTVEFDISNPRFINAYFKILHNPYEDEGVDFWWIDWQQGKKSKLKSLDPLWALNHYHFLDSSRKNKRPLILSRFAGAGSHRYPLGFSGDTFICWRNLKFQPYFTSTAANIGYTWWSHDIGGHMFGIKSDELYLRWIQFGTFSPINRLHSTSHDLQGKEPWNFSHTINEYTKKFLALRHSLIPYLHSMNYRTHMDSIALCEPMYYLHSNEEDAYKYNNQYYFGSELLVAPIVSKLNKRLLMSKTRVWLPKGRWTDILTGHIYQGNKVIDMHRGLENIPVLAKEGAIIPFSKDKGNIWQNPTNIEIYIYRGNNKFTLYEDDGQTRDYLNGAFAMTEFEVREHKDSLEFIMNGIKGNLSNIPTKRSYQFTFKDIVDGNITVEKNGQKHKEFIKTVDNQISLEIDISPEDSIKIMIKDYKIKTNGDYRENARLLMSKYQSGNISKMLMYRKFKKLNSRQDYIFQANKLSLKFKPLRAALIEILQE